MRRALHDHFGRVLVAAGWLCIGLSTICGFGFAAGTTLPPGGDLISLVAMIVFVLTGQRLIRHGKKIRSATADAVLETDPRRPIVYLRSFRDDEIAAKFAPQPKVATEEEMLTTVLAEIGPVIAIGRPGEPSPQIGAARFYVEDDRWQRRVNELVCTAQLVVARAGDTQGLRWELEQVVQQVPPTRFLLIVPFHGADYERFASTLGGIFPKGLPASVQTSGDQRAVVGVSAEAFVYFQPDWSPTVVVLSHKLRRGQPWYFVVRNLPGEAYFKLALRPVFEHIGVPWQSPFEDTFLRITAVAKLLFFSSLVACIAFFFIAETWFPETLAVVQNSINSLEQWIRNQLAHL